MIDPVHQSLPLAGYAAAAGRYLMVTFYATLSKLRLRCGVRVRPLSWHAQRPIQPAVLRRRRRAAVLHRGRDGTSRPGAAAGGLPRAIWVRSDPLPPASARSRVDGDRRRRRGAAQTTVWGRPCTRVPPVFKRNRR
jgi:hypothetical protein